MKNNVFLLLALCVTAPLLADTNGFVVVGIPPFDEEMASLPLQAGVCDIVGTGIVTGNNTNGITINVENYWVGNPGSNTLEIQMFSFKPPVTNTPIVFLASRYSSFFALEPEACRYSYIFDMNYHRNRNQPDGLWLFENEYSWFPIVPTNTALVAFASNLVYAAQITANTNRFYEIIRDGYRDNPPTSRIHKDSAWTFQNCRYFMPTNFMRQIWNDDLLTNEIRSDVNNAYRLETGIFLPDL